MPHKLLIVDDETPIADAMASYFQKSGYTVEIAGERDRAEALLESGTYAAILLDLRLAGGTSDGLELASFAREHCPTARIVVLTAYGTSAAEAEAHKRGVDAFLHKPQPLPDLAQLLLALLGERVS